MELDAESEAQELRSLVAAFERERGELLDQLTACEEELAVERERAADLDAEVQHLRSKEMLLQSPTVNLNDDELELLRQKVDESAVVITDLEARLAAAEEGEAHLMRVVDEREAAHRAKVSALAAKLTTAEMENRKLAAAPANSQSPRRPTKLRLCADQPGRSPVQRGASRPQEEPPADTDHEVRGWKLKWKEAEGRRIEADAEVLRLRGELAEWHLHKDSIESPVAAPAPPPGHAQAHQAGDRLMLDPEVSPGGLREMSEPQLAGLLGQYDSRIKHFAALQRDVRRALHQALPGKHPDPDAEPLPAAAAAAASPPAAQGDPARSLLADLEADDTREVLDAGWLELAHWMRCRFGRNTSLKELRKHVEGFQPRRLRIPGVGDSASGAFAKAPDSPVSHASSQPSTLWAAREVGTGLDRLDNNEGVRRAFLEGRREGRALYASDHARDGGVEHAGEPLSRQALEGRVRRMLGDGDSPPQGAAPGRYRGERWEREGYGRGEGHGVSERRLHDNIDRRAYGGDRRGAGDAPREREYSYGSGGGGVRGGGGWGSSGHLRRDRDAEWDRDSEHRSSSSRTPSSPSARSGYVLRAHDVRYDQRYAARDLY